MFRDFCEATRLANRKCAPKRTAVPTGDSTPRFIPLAQVVLKEAWIKVEAGFRPGREIMLSKDETLIGKAEGCDIGGLTVEVDRVFGVDLEMGGDFGIERAEHVGPDPDEVGDANARIAQQLEGRAEPLDVIGEDDLVVGPQ